MHISLTMLSICNVNKHYDKMLRELCCVAIILLVTIMTSKLLLCLQAKNHRISVGGLSAQHCLLFIIPMEKWNFACFRDWQNFHGQK